jgi:chromosome partitioning protein
MKVVTIASRKGGSGKSTLAAHMSVLGSGPEDPSVLIDLDPQHSLTDWWGLRRDHAPLLVDATVNHLLDIIRLAKTEGVGWVFIDTPPHAQADISAAMRVADLVLIPLRPSFFDLKAAEGTLQMARALNRTALAVLNAVPPPRFFSEASVVRDARAVLEELGVPLANSTLGDRSVFRHAVIGGKSVVEMEPYGKAAAEIRALWEEVCGHLLVEVAA